MMTEWDRALGKVLLVFTYGSGCASSMYQLRFDDIMWMEPLGVWKFKTFYRDALYQRPDFPIHQVYIETWMKFDYRPRGRKTFGIPPESYQLDVYYLMEIDPWGRRFFHRGGMRAGPYTKEARAKMSDNAKHYDKTELRSMRAKFGDLPPEGDYWDRFNQRGDQDPAKELEDRWKAIEYEMCYDFNMDDAASQVIESKPAKGNRGTTLVVVEKGQPNAWMVPNENDGQPHGYCIVGTWTCMQVPEEMQPQRDGSFTFEVTLGANAWEQFYLVQDGDFGRPIFPAYERSYKDMPCIGPVFNRKPDKFWLINGNPPDDLPNEDFGEPGDKYLVTFQWDNLKRLTWHKTKSREEAYTDTASYWISGSWTCWDLIELPKDLAEEGRYSMEVQKTPLDLKFHILRNQDPMQRIYPELEEGYGDAYSKVAVNEYGTEKYWNISGMDGEVFQLVLQRDPSDLSEVTVKWEKLGSRTLEVIPDRYFLAGTPNNWGKEGYYHELQWNEEATGWTVDVQIWAIPTEFVIIVNKNGERIIHPDKKDCSQIQAHEVQGPDNDVQGRHWHIGKSIADKARVNDTFMVKLELEPRKVSWKKKEG